MVIIVTPASEINKAEKWKWWLWLAWCGICKATAKRIFISLFQVPAQYRQTDSAIRAHALMEDGWKDLTSRGRSVQPIIPASVECSICYTLHSGKKLTNNIDQCCIFSEELDIYGAATRNVQITSNWRFLLPLWKRLNAFYCCRSWRPKPVIWWVSFIFARPLSTFNLKRLLSDANLNYHFTTINASAWNFRNVPFQTCTLSATAAVYSNTVTKSVSWFLKNDLFPCIFNASFIKSEIILEPIEPLNLLNEKKKC